jgi:hypothetical protein
MTDNRKPSEVTDVYWLYARGYRSKKNSMAGKWLLFVSVKNIDSTWALIKKATEDRKLGPASKVATMRPNPNATSESTRVICVYTYDSTDESDVYRVRDALRELGFSELIYKTDADTLAGKYSNRGDRHISKYRD